MTPYYQDEWATIYHGDCREVLPSLGPVDLVLTDPPYGMDNNCDYSRFSGGNTRRGPGTKHNNIEGDKQPFDPTPLLGYPRVIIWGANHFWHKLPAGGCLVWLKRNDSAFGTFLSDAEIAYISNSQGVYCFRRIFAGSQKAVDAGLSPYQPSAHPNQKPLSLMKWCLSFSSNAQTILDPFMGSGTTLRAAKDLGRQSIGIEIEERYCEIAAKRLQQEVLNFEPAPVASAEQMEFSE